MKAISFPGASIQVSLLEEFTVIVLEHAKLVHPRSKSYVHQIVQLAYMSASMNQTSLCTHSCGLVESTEN